MKATGKGNFAQGKDESHYLQLPRLLPQTRMATHAHTKGCHSPKEKWPAPVCDLAPSSKMALASLTRSSEAPRTPAGPSRQMTRAPAGSEGKSASARGACAEGCGRWEAGGTCDRPQALGLLQRPPRSPPELPFLSLLPPLPESEPSGRSRRQCREGR